MSSNYWNRAQSFQAPKPPPTHYVSNKHKKTIEGIDNYEKVLNDLIDTRSLADHPELLQELFSRQGIAPYYEHFMATYKAPLTPAYHALLHSQQTALNAYEGGIYSGFSNKELQSALVAGLYHDASHTRGKCEDRGNIAYALDELSFAHGKAPAHLKLSEEQYEEVRTAIRLTEYPYKTNTKHALGKLLRDADRMAIYTSDPDQCLDLFLGLLAEINDRREYYPYENGAAPISITRFCEQQLTFTTMIQWNTQWGKTKAFHRNWPAMAKRVIGLLKLHEAA